LLLLAVSTFESKAVALASDTSIVANGVKHWYRIAGVKSAKTPLVIIHGGPGGNHYVFERTIGKLLEQNHRVIYYEQRGSGRSDKPGNGNYAIDTLVHDLEVIRRKLGLKKIIPLGYSFGSQLALEYALKHPDRVEKLILEAPAFLNKEDGTTLIQIAGFRSIADSTQLAKIQAILETEKSLQDKLTDIWGNTPGSQVDKFLFQSQEIARQNRKMWRASGIKNNGEMVQYLLKNTPEKSLIQRSSAIKCPTLLLTGMHDRNGAFETAMRLAEGNKNFQLKLFAKSAHFPDLEETELFYQRVTAFLQ